MTGPIVQMIDVAQVVGLMATFVASFLAVIVVLWVERARKPVLRFEVEKNPQIADGLKFLHVLVHNRKMNRVLGFFVQRQPALMCRATITFLTENNAPIFRVGHRMRGRWASTPDPVLPIATQDGKLVFLRDPTRTRDDIDIPPDSSELLDVVMRPPDQDSCFGWHNDFIQNPQRTADQVFELPRGRYHVLIRVRTGGEDFKQVFRIVNDVPFEHVRLEDLKPQPKLEEAL